MRFILPLIIISSFWIFFCESPKKSLAHRPSTAQIQNLLEDYYATMSARDWTRYKKFFSDDATLTTIWQNETDTLPNILTTSISDFILQTKDGPDSQPIFEEKMLSHAITVKNNLASAWVKYEAKFGTTDELMKWKGLDLFSFLKHNNEWKIISIVFESE